MNQSVLDFFAAWGKADQAVQAKVIVETLTADARYVDPRTPDPLIGPRAIADYVAQFSEMAPGAVAEVADSSERDGIIRATIRFRMADGMEQLGQYFVETDATGKLTRLVGFVGTGAS